MNYFLIYILIRLNPKFYRIEKLETKIINFRLPKTIKLRKFKKKIVNKIKRILNFKSIKSTSRSEITLYKNFIPTNSLSLQDYFVIETLMQKRKGTYVEIGAGWYQRISNTYVLEKFYDWKGVSLDLNKKLVDEFNKNRQNKCYCSDALTTDYEKLFAKDKLPSKIDYLSLDIDPASQTLRVLLLLPFESYQFGVITFEHDSYVNGNSIKYLSRSFLLMNGYKLAKSNVKAKNFGKYEDWWIHKNIKDFY